MCSKLMMKRCTASSSLISPSENFEVSRYKMLENTSSYNRNKNRRSMQFSPSFQLDDKCLSRHYIQSTSSGYSSLDDTGSLSSNASCPRRESAKIVKEKCDTNICSSSTKTALSTIHTTSKHTSILQASKKSCQDNGKSDICMPKICTNCKPTLAEWEKTYYLCETTIIEQTKIISKKDKELFRKDYDLRKIKMELKALKKELYELKEHRDDLSNGLLMINNILSAEGDTTLRKKIYEVFENIDIMGELENDVFENPKTALSRDELCINNFKPMDKDRSNEIGSSTAFSYNYLSSEEEKDYSPSSGSDVNLSSQRRHSVAFGMSTRPSKTTQTDRRNSMVIKTVIELGPENDSIQRTPCIESIQLGSNEIKNGLIRRSFHDENYYPINRRHSMQPVTHSHGPKSKRCQSSYAPYDSIAISSPKLVKSVINESNDETEESLSSEILVCHREPVVTSSTRVGYPRKASSLIKEHSFQRNIFMVGRKCSPCGSRIKVGKTGYRCNDCSTICHLECMHIVPPRCFSNKNKDEISKDTSDKICNYFQSPPICDFQNIIF